MQDKKISQEAETSNTTEISSRRDFMKKYGALAAITPAVLSGAVTSGAVAQSGAGGPRDPSRPPGTYGG